MAKAASPDQAILAGLQKAIDALPAELKLNGPGGVFATGAAGANLAHIAIAEGFLEKKVVTGSTGRSKSVVYGAITSKGLQHVQDVKSPKAALESLLPVLQAVGKQPDQPNVEIFRAELGKATETCVSTLKFAFAKLETDILKALASKPAAIADTSMVLRAVHHALERLKAPSAPALSVATIPVLEDEIVSFVQRWLHETTVGCQFDVLWNHLKHGHPQLTIGAFQDTLRRLHDSNRIRLGSWPRMLDDIPKPELALFISSKVMYYAQNLH